MVSWKPKGSTVYVSSDGDDIGSHVAAAILSGNVKQAKKLSLLINLGGKVTERFAKSHWGAQVVIMGGDDLMIQTSPAKFNTEDIEPMRKEYQAKTKATLSCGIGSTPEEAMKAIVIAKNTGKNKAVFWQDSMEATYNKVVKDRINNLKTKLRASGGRVMESEGNISPELKKHVKKELRRLLRQRKRRNQQSQGSTRRAPASWPRPSKRPAGPSPAAKAAQERKKKAAAMHQPKMVDLMRKFIVRHRAEHIDNMRKAHTLHMMGHEKEARAIRTLEKLRYQKMLKDRDVLHTAASLRDPTHLPKSLTKTVSNIRDTMASRVKATRKEARKLGLKQALEKHKKAVADAKEGLRRFRVAAHEKFRAQHHPIQQLSLPRHLRHSFSRAETKKYDLALYNARKSDALHSHPITQLSTPEKYRKTVANFRKMRIQAQDQARAKVLKDNPIRQLKSKSTDRNVSSKAVAPRAKSVAPKTPESVKPVHPQHTPDTAKTPKLKKSPSNAPKFLNPNKPANKFRRRGY